MAEEEVLCVLLGARHHGLAVQITPSLSQPQGSSRDPRLRCAGHLARIRGLALSLNVFSFGFSQAKQSLVIVMNHPLLDRKMHHMVYLA